MDGLIFDYFAGGGGASQGLTDAMSRHVDVAINHCPAAIAMHEANHPATLHLKENVWDVDPVRDLPPGPVAMAWFSPTCTHFSRARGGKPVSKQLRALPWVATRFAKARHPAIVFLENVPEFVTWGPVGADGQPVPEKRGATFRAFVRRLERLGYVVEWRELSAHHYGAPTTRKRLFLVARCDDQPIVWPKATHGPGLLPYRTAAECIDWSVPCPSIFERKRPLAEATQRRIAEGIRRYVLDSQRPFIVQVNHGRDVNRSQDAGRPMPTISTKHGFGVVTPALVQYNGQSNAQDIGAPVPTLTTKDRFALLSPTLIQTGYGERKGQAPRQLDLFSPLGTIVAGGAKHALVSAWIVKHYGGVVGHEPTRPLGTVTTTDHHGVVAAHLTKFYGTSIGQPLDAPAPAVTAGGQHIGLVTAFLKRHLGEHINNRVELEGEVYSIADIGLRMLTPRELARAQGFPADYVLTGTQAEQIGRIGNSVCPTVARALVAANTMERRRAA